MRAAAYTNVEQCEWLLDAGAAVNLRDTATNATPHMHALGKHLGLGDTASRKRIRPTLDLLIERGADITARASHSGHGTSTRRRASSAGSCSCPVRAASRSRCLPAGGG